MAESNSQKRHCWECLRRRLVCDSTRPVCKRCVLNGTDCPGYSEAKPPRFKWLAPGKVTSRTRKKKNTTTTTISTTTPTPVNNNNKNVAKLPRNSSADNNNNKTLPLSRFKIKTDVCALFESAEYCKHFPLGLPSQCLTPACQQSQRNHL